MNKHLFILMLLSLAIMSIQAQTKEQADSLHQLGKECLNKGNIAEGRAYTRQAMEIRGKLQGELSEEYISSLNNYAISFAMEDDYAKATELQEKVILLCSKLKHPHKDIGMYTTNMGRFYYLNGNSSKAANMWEQALPLVEKHGEVYEFLLNSLCSIYSEKNNSQALERIIALMEEHNKHELSKPCNAPECMFERAKYYEATGDNAMAKECYQKVLNMHKSIEQEIEVLEEYAYFMAITMGDRITGAEYQYKAASLIGSQGKTTPQYAKAIYTSGVYYSLAMTNEGWRKAIECYDMALLVYRTLDNKAKVVKCQQMMGIAYNGLKEYGKAKSCFVEAVAYYEANDKDNPDYPKLIERLAVAEKFNKEYDASIYHYEQALLLYQQRGMATEYGNAVNGLKLCYAYAGKEVPELLSKKMEDAVKSEESKKLVRIIEEEKSSLELSKNYLGKHTYARSLATIASCYAMLDDKNESLDYYKQYMSAIREALRDEFRTQGENERMQTWKDNSETITEFKEFFIELPDEYKQGKNDATSLMFDSELLSKGILLNSSIEFQKLLNENNDKRLLELFGQLNKNKAEIEHLRKNSRSEADLNKILELTQANQQLQIELNNGCKEMDDFTRYISYDWRDVQNALGKDDICIEFAAVNMGYHDVETHMIALLLTKDMPQPVAVTIWNEDKLIEYCESDSYDKLQSDYVYSGYDKAALKKIRLTLDSVNVAIKPEISLYLNYLETQADTTKGVFLPTPLFTIRYEQLLNQGDIIFNTPDAGDIIWGRISEYLQGKKRIFFSADGLLNSLAIEYFQYKGKPLSEQFEVYRLSSTKELCSKHEGAETVKSALFGDINYNEEGTENETIKQRLVALRDADGLANLDYTRREINEIALLLNGKYGNTVSKFSDTDASKNTFLKLDGSQVGILHIATHGMYVSKKKTTDDEAMSNSLLAFANASMDESNFVSAAEIASMNLRKCDLAVLSACETGLGKLGGDGVFGLQRGFKNAGVKTLLMSLKKVHDQSTAELMICFYKHMMKGMSKRAAFVEAQKDIRAMGFNAPQFWATFILLDAIE